jgi:hypothetical protein
MCDRYWQEKSRKYSESNVDETLSDKIEAVKSKSFQTLVFTNITPSLSKTEISKRFRALILSLASNLINLRPTKEGKKSAQTANQLMVCFA